MGWRDQQKFVRFVRFLLLLLSVLLLLLFVLLLLWNVQAKRSPGSLHHLGWRDQQKSNLSGLRDNFCCLLLLLLFFIVVIFVIELECAGIAAVFSCGEEMICNEEIARRSRSCQSNRSHHHILEILNMI